MLKRFIDFVYTEKIEIIPPKENSKKVAVFLGRFQPLTKAHVEIIRKIEKAEKLPVVVFIVKGKKTSQNKEKNPFPLDIQIELFKKVFGNKVEVKTIPTGFIGDIINTLRQEGKEPLVLYCGSDRVKGYEGQLKRYEDIFFANIKVKEVPRTNEDISATKVRNALKNNDFETFKKNTDKAIWNEFEKLKKYIQE